MTNFDEELPLEKPKWWYSGVSITKNGKLESVKLTPEQLEEIKNIPVGGIETEWYLNCLVQKFIKENEKE